MTPLSHDEFPYGKYRRALYGLLESELKARTTGDWLELLHAHRIPATKVKSVIDILNDPHVLATGLIQQSEHPTVGQVRTARLPLRFSRSRPPFLGPHHCSESRITS